MATHLLEDGAQLEQVKEILGHKSIITTMKYIHMGKEMIF